MEISKHVVSSDDIKYMWSYMHMHATLLLYIIA
jgi:hypothetical protein